MELNDRKKLILKAIIANYLETGEPVGSRTIAKHPELNLSSATIRNEMADLEDMGYILQPHTSAGRIPSDTGYRFYVDQLMTERDSEHEEKQALIQRVDKMEVLLKQVANALANSTSYATMVSSPHYQNVTLKFVQLSQVDHEHLLAVIVTQGNIVKNKMIQVEEPLSNEDVLKLNVLLNTFLQGLSLQDINLALIQTMREQAGIRQDVLERILEEIAKAIHDADHMEIYTGGATNILKYPELGNPDTATELLDTLVEKKALTKLVDSTLESDSDNHTGIQVYIGEESPVKNMKDCSIVTATYELAEGGTGTVGIIGPKRMDYKKVVKTLKNLTEELDDIFKDIKDTETKEEASKETEETKEAAADDKIAELEASVADWKDKYQRLMAEFENARKRTAKEATQRYDMGAMGVLEKLLPVIDNFERGLEAVSEEEKDSAFVKGIEQIYKQFVAVMEDVGVTPMDAQGKEFDANLHNAVMHVEDDEFGENIVAEELQKGYMYKENVLRHSMVKVAN